MHYPKWLRLQTITLDSLDDLSNTQEPFVIIDNDHCVSYSCLHDQIGIAVTILSLCVHIYEITQKAITKDSEALSAASLRC